MSIKISWLYLASTTAPPPPPPLLPFPSLPRRAIDNTGRAVEIDPLWLIIGTAIYVGRGSTVTYGPGRTNILRPQTI